METNLLSKKQKSFCISIAVILLCLNTLSIHAQLFSGMVPADPFNESLIAHKYRGLKTAGNSGGKEINIGLTSLMVPANRIENNLTYTSVMAFSLTYSPIKNEFTNVTTTGPIIKTVKTSLAESLIAAGKNHTLADLNYFQIEAANQTSGSAITISNLSLNGNSIPGTYSNGTAGSAFWYNSNLLSLSGGFTITGSIQLSGTFGAGLNQNYIEFVFGYARSFASLPLSWNDVSARKLNSTVSVEWSTLQEVNTDKFEVERSSSGNIFQKIATVNGHGNSNVIQEYKAIDATPINGINYYRIKQIDRNGRYTYSKTVAVNIKNNKPEIVSVNNSILNIQFTSTAKRTVQLINMNGVILKNEISGNAVYQTVLATLPKGMYMVRIVEDDGSAHSQKIIL